MYSYLLKPISWLSICCSTIAYQLANQFQNYISTILDLCIVQRFKVQQDCNRAWQESTGMRPEPSEKSHILMKISPPVVKSRAVEFWNMKSFTCVQYMHHRALCSSQMLDSNAAAIYVILSWHFCPPFVSVSLVVCYRFEQVTFRVWRGRTQVSQFPPFSLSSHGLRNRIRGTKFARSNMKSDA